MSEIAAAVEVAIESLNKKLNRLPSSSRRTFLSSLEYTIRCFNDVLSKRRLATTEGGRCFGKLLLEDKRFLKMRAAVDERVTYAYRHGLVSTPEFDAQVAEFWSNWYYALLVSPASAREEEALAQLVLEICHRAIQHVVTDGERLKLTGIEAIADGVQIIGDRAIQERRDRLAPEFNPFDYRAILPEETAQIFSETLIPLLHLQGKILSGAYCSKVRDDTAFYRVLEMTESIDASCMATLNRPPHIAVAIMKRIPLQNIARNSIDLDNLETCLYLTDVCKAKYGNVYREDGLIIDWATDPLNLSITAEIKGRCLLKLGRFPEAYNAFLNMRKYAEEMGRIVRAGWAEFFMAQAAKYFLVPDDVISHIHILELLESAKKKESTSLTKTWARDEISDEIEAWEQCIIKNMHEANAFCPESTLNRPGKLMLPGFNSMADPSIDVAVSPLEVEDSDNERKLFHHKSR